MIRFPNDSESIERYLEDIRSLPPISDDERAAIFAAAKAGDQPARERIVLAHLGFAVKIASRYAGYGLPLADLISEANLGLLRAAELYDASFGTEFTTYAAVWMKQRIHRAISAQAHAVRVPVWRSQRLRKLDRLHEELSAELGKDASFEDLAERLGLDAGQVGAISEDRISVTTLPDEIGPSSQPLAPERLSQEELLEEIGACLNDLTDDELRILSSKFGLHQEAPQSYREMAPAFGRSREWIRRIGEGALAKVRTALQSASNLPRHLVRSRQEQAIRRIRKLTAKTSVGAGKLSVFPMALNQWLEPLIIAL